MPLRPAFADRAEAGRRLAAALEDRIAGPGVVLALPRGGVPVAAEVARAFGLPLDLVFVRKVGLPGHSELALAAIAGPQGEVTVVNRAIAASAGYDDTAIARLADPERAELLRRRARYTAGRPSAPIEGRTAILVDDGIATGATAEAALIAARALHPARLILAVPVAPDDTLDRLARHADAVVCLETPDPFIAVGAHYSSFPQVSDEEVIAALAAADGKGEVPEKV